MSRPKKERAVLTRREFADELGISLSSADDLLKQNKKLYFTAGRRILIPRAAFQKWLESQTA